MLGGFTFKGIHSSTYGIRETPRDTVLSPRKRRTIIEIPGKSRGFIQEDGGYESRIESMLCTYAKQDGVDIELQKRIIAGWLDGVGELTFDREPTIHYNAFLSSPPPTVTMLEFAQFTLQFTMNPPFGYETAIQQSQLIGGSTPNNLVEIETEGTVATPVRIIITNMSDKVINELKIYHKHVSN